jgi:hypothetical protein
MAEIALAKRHCQLTDESQELIRVGDPRTWPLIT